ncbi:MAG: hypothetical protein DRH26_19215 [Deltaproteobacteria bacterium]|nr:MAG: hypothetical protein DRH26_19215 [Deltaproteobacteria bacterium]
MIYLYDSQILKRGTTRVCYQYHHKPDLIVKIAVNGNKEGVSANLRELDGYQYLIREHADLDRISHCLGFITTDKGKGLVCQCIRDDNGEVSKSVWDIIVYQEDHDIAHIKSVLTDFCEYLRDNDIFLFDLNLKNILLQEKSGGTYIPHVIDLKGRYDLNEFIPFSKYSKFFARKKLKRRTRQLLERVEQYRHIKSELKKIDTCLNKEIFS